MLQYVYDYEKHTILHALRGILGLSNVETEDPLTVAHALVWMEGGLDFADALHVASSQPAKAFVTFDEKLQKKAKTLTSIPVELL